MRTTTLFRQSDCTHSKAFVELVFPKLNHVVWIFVLLWKSCEVLRTTVDFLQFWVSTDVTHPEWRPTITVMYVGEHLIPYTLQNMWHQSLAIHVGQIQPHLNLRERRRAFNEVLFVLLAAKLNGITSNVTANESLRAQETTIRQRKNQALRTNFNVSRDTRKPISNGDNT